MAPLSINKISLIHLEPVSSLQKMQAGDIIGLYGPGGEDIVVAQAWAQRFTHAIIKRGEDARHYYSLHSQVQPGTITIHLLDNYPINRDNYDLVYAINHRVSGGLLPSLIYDRQK